MRAIGEALRAELDGGETTLCRCWRIARGDGVVMGFTDHDRALAFLGLAFEPETGFARTEMESSLGLSVDNVEASGALRSDRISEADVLAGRYDGAEVTQWLVDWRDPSRRLKVFQGRAGEIRRGELGFEMEVLGAAELLNRPLGRLYQRLCDAELGDARCGVALTGPLTKAGTVVSVQDARRFVASGAVEGAENGFFSLGRIEWKSGGSAGVVQAVRDFGRQGFESGGVVIDLWNAPEAPVAVGDGFELVAGCDKTAATCKTKFGNFVNFRGFPLMPGEDWMTAYPRSDESHDGGSLFDG